MAPFDDIACCKFAINFPAILFRPRVVVFPEKIDKEKGRGQQKFGLLCGAIPGWSTLKQKGFSTALINVHTAGGRALSCERRVATNLTAKTQAAEIGCDN